MRGLVATTCEDPCDWQAALQVPHDVSDCANLSYDDLLIVRNGDDAPDLCQFLSRKEVTGRVKKEDSELVKEETEEDCRTCCVVGCEDGFPDSQPHGFFFTQLTSRGLCQMHYILDVGSETRHGSACSLIRTFTTLPRTAIPRTPSVGS